MKKRINNIILICSIILCSQCQTSDTSDELALAIEKSNSSNIDTIDLKDVYRFPWDDLYIFHEFVDTDQINEIIDVECKCDMVPDSFEMYIFLKDGIVVDKRLVESLKYHFSITDYIDFEKTITISSNKSKFNIIKNNQNHYILNPVANTSNN